MINYPVLVLNQSYEPLAVCHARRAVVLIFQGKAEMLEDGRGYIHSVDETVPLPSVIRLARMVRRPHRQRKMNRHEIFHRDNYTCQYCGEQSHHLTLDHIMPRFRGGPHTWENVVSCCATCNRNKAGRTPEEAHMKLRSKPGPPSNDTRFTVPFRYSGKRDEWGKYLAYYQG